MQIYLNKLPLRSLTVQEQTRTIGVLKYMLPQLSFGVAFFLPFFVISSLRKEADSISKREGSLCSMKTCIRFTPLHLQMHTPHLFCVLPRKGKTLQCSVSTVCSTIPSLQEALKNISQTFRGEKGNSIDFSESSLLINIKGMNSDLHSLVSGIFPQSWLLW